MNTQRGQQEQRTAFSQFRLKVSLRSLVWLVLALFSAAALAQASRPANFYVWWTDMGYITPPTVAQFTSGPFGTVAAVPYYAALNQFDAYSQDDACRGLANMYSNQNYYSPYKVAGYYLNFPGYTNPTTGLPYSCVMLISSGGIAIYSSNPSQHTWCPVEPSPLTPWTISGNSCVRNAPDPDPNAGSCPSDQGASSGAPLTDNPINIGTGNKFVEDEDFRVGALRLVRRYNSQASRVRLPLSPSWVRNWDRSISSFDSYDLVYRPDGRALVATMPVNGVPTNGKLAWILPPFSGDQLTQLYDSTGTVVEGWLFIAEDGSIEKYDANGRLTSIQTWQGHTQYLSYTDGSTGPFGAYALTTAGAPTTTLLPAGLLLRVVDDFGRTAWFGYDSTGHGIAAADGLGQTYLYGYDANINLTSVTYPDSHVKQYLNNEPADVGAYFSQAITGIVDENGTRFATYGYDAQGRAVSSKHWADSAASVAVDSTSVAFSTDGNGNPLSSSVTDALNTSRTFNLQSIQSLVKGSGVSQPGGAGCGPAGTAQTFDTNGNRTSAKDFNGNLTCFASDTTRNLETARLEGVASGSSCPGTLSTYHPAAGTAQRLTQTTWHPTFRLKTAQAAPLKTTYWIYNGQPDPSNGNATASCAPTQVTTSAPGALLHFEGANGSTAIVDSLGHDFVAYGADAVSTTQFAVGSSSLQLGGGRVTTPPSTDFDLPGDFTIEAWLYYNTVSSSVRQMFLTRDIGSGSGVGKWEFGLNIVSSGNFSLYRHTTAGVTQDINWPWEPTAATWYHVAIVRSGSNWTLYINGVAAGTVADSNPMPITSSSLVIGNTGTGSGAAMSGYIDELRITSGVAVYTATFSPPTAPLSPISSQVPNLLVDGSVPAVLCKKVEQATTDATGGAGFSATPNGAPRVWTYTYNQWGQRLTETGPRGNLPRSDPNYAPATTTYVYYAATDTASSPPNYQIGDLAQITDAVGHVTQFLQYDGNGRLLQQVDANGTTTSLTYFPRGWLASRTVTPPGSSTGQTTSYVYDGVGQLKTVTLPDGSQIAYTYDAAHRLMQAADSAGDTISYTLDARGNRTLEQVKDPAGNLTRQVSRVYDALNRLQTVTGALQ